MTSDAIIEEKRSFRKPPCRSTVCRKFRLACLMVTDSEGQRRRRRVSDVCPTELFVFCNLRRRCGQCRDQEPPHENWLVGLPGKLQALAGKFCEVVAHKEGSNSGLIFGSTRWAPIVGAHLVPPILGPENDRSFGARFCADLHRFSKPTPKHKSRWTKNLGHKTDGSRGGLQHGSTSCLCRGFGGGAKQCRVGTVTFQMRCYLLAWVSFGAKNNSLRDHSAS